MNCNCLSSYIFTPPLYNNGAMNPYNGSLDYTNIGYCNMQQLQNEQMVSEPIITNYPVATGDCSYSTNRCVDCVDNCSICSACPNYCPAPDLQPSPPGVSTIPISECQCSLAMNQPVNQTCSGVLNDAPISDPSGICSISTRPNFKRKYNAGPGAIETIADGSIYCSQNCGYSNTPLAPLIMFYGRDESYPYELNKLIHPTSCELCNVQMNSLRSARDHFSSKVHDRNITLWLKKEFADRDLATPIVKRFFSNPMNTTDILYCDICNLTLTSVTHANQHYAGKKHCLILSKIQKYAMDIAYFNQHITQTKENANRFDIKRVISNMGNSISNSKFNPQYRQMICKPIQPTNYTNQPDLYCNLCNIGCTSATQMMMHLSGNKHKRNKNKEMYKIDRRQTVAGNFIENGSTNGNNYASGYNPRINNIEFINNTDYMNNCIETNSANEYMDNNNNYNNFNNDNSTNIDNANVITMYRTPSGKYYCKICNKNLPTPLMMQEHLRGKRHNKAEMEYNAKASILYGQAPVPYGQVGM